MIGAAQARTLTEESLEKAYVKLHAEIQSSIVEACEKGEYTTIVYIPDECYRYLTEITSTLTELGFEVTSKRPTICISWIGEQDVK